MIDNIYACEAGEHLGVQGLRFSKPVPVILKSLQIVFVLDHSLSVVLKIVTITAEHFLHFSFKKTLRLVLLQFVCLCNVFEHLGPCHHGII